jgi:muramoyltetrapeptide carboxypeptidase
MHQPTVKPPALRPGDTIGIVSTSSPCPPEALDRMEAYLRGKGYGVKRSPHVLASRGYLAGSAEDRATDLNTLFADPQVRMILTAFGGKGANEILPLLDWDLIRSNPKIFVGLSDPSVIANAITARTGIVTFHGPTGYDFGVTGIHAFTEPWFWKAVTGGHAVPWELDVSGSRVVRQGREVSGPLVGGHLGTLQSLIGTPWSPQWDGDILFVEEIFTDWERIDAMLTHLRLAGVFDRVRGLIVGRCVDCKCQSPADTDFYQMILRCVGRRFPILAEVPLGHTPEKLTLPLGVPVRLRTNPPSLEVLERGVQLSGKEAT